MQRTRNKPRGGYKQYINDMGQVVWLQDNPDRCPECGAVWHLKKT